MNLSRFVLDGLRAMASGGAAYRRWLAALAAVVAAGLFAYGGQLQQGMVVTGMSDQVSWGFYIANFAFLVGIAAAAVLLVIPAYLFHRGDVKQVVIYGEALAVAAVVAAMLFVTVDIGRPERIWHMLPLVGRFNWPQSMLAWDVVVLVGYLLLNLGLPAYVLHARWRGEEPVTARYFPVVVVAIFWAVSIHTVTAFLFSANAGRPLWHSALLAPRFIASAFASGPALIILALLALRRWGGLAVKQSVIDLLAVVMTVALQISLFFVGVELFTDFYNETSHAASIRYLFFGLAGAGQLQPWIWSALALNVVAVVILSIHPLRRTPRLLALACGLAFLGIWIEKGMGLVVPGYIPTPLGEIFEYAPSWREWLVSAGIWACGALVFTLLAKAALAFDTGRARARPAADVKAS